MLERMPFDAKAMAVFELQRRAAAGEIQVDDREVERITAAYARALQESKPPLAAGQVQGEAAASGR